MIAAGAMWLAVLIDELLPLCEFAITTTGGVALGQISQSSLRGRFSSADLLAVGDAAL